MFCCVPKSGWIIASQRVWHWLFCGTGSHYEEKGVFERLMDRLRRIVPRAQGYGPVMLPALR